MTSAAALLTATVGTKTSGPKMSEHEPTSRKLSTIETSMREGTARSGAEPIHCVYADTSTMSAASVTTAPQLRCP